MIPANGDVCALCAYWSKRDWPFLEKGKPESAACRRNPPPLPPRPDDGTQAQWPRTFHDRWCGEFVRYRP